MFLARAVPPLLLSSAGSGIFLSFGLACGNLSDATSIADHIRWALGALKSG